MSINKPPSCRIWLSVPLIHLSWEQIFIVSSTPTVLEEILCELGQRKRLPHTLLSSTYVTCRKDVAVWETKESGWPQGGEIDILEGVNDQGPNTATLHTTAGCRMPSQPFRYQTGQSRSGQLDCDALVNGNAGCSVAFPGSDSYGPSFNEDGGGWFALERTNTSINVWFWSRSCLSVPLEIKQGSRTVSPLNWGLPTANFPNTYCNFSSHFSEQNIIINLTLCGDWAGSVYNASGCPSTCVDFVNNNPASFENAYFDFASIRIYEAGKTSTPTTSCDISNPTSLELQ